MKLLLLDMCYEDLRNGSTDMIGYRGRVDMVSVGMCVFEYGGRIDTVCTWTL